MKIQFRFLLTLIFLTTIIGVHASEQIERVFYFVRHGSTDWGMDRILEGPLNLSLNSKGREEAEALARTFSELSGDKPTHILHSPLVRCKETTTILSENLKILETKEYTNLQEVYRGDWSKLQDEAKELTAKLLLNKDYVGLSKIKVDDAEEWRDFLNRIDLVISDCLLYCKDIPIIVTHGQVVKEFLKKKNCWSEMKWEGESRPPIKVTVNGMSWSAKII